MADNDDFMPPSAGEDPSAGSHGMAGLEKKPRRKKHVDLRVAPLNITSFLDMSFCLLMFLIMAASFSGAEGVITVKMPMSSDPGGGGATPPPRKITVLLSPGGADTCRIAIEGMGEAPRSFIDLGDLLVKLSNNPARGTTGPFGLKDTQVMIQPEGSVRWQHVVNAFNAAIGARFENVAFAPIASGG